MRFATYLDESETSDSEFARLIESGRVAVGRYRRGERMPETTMMEKIYQITNGAVTAQDMHETRLEWLAAQQTPIRIASTEKQSAPRIQSGAGSRAESPSQASDQNKEAAE